MIQIDEDPNWQDSIINYLVNKNLPNDKYDARKIKQKGARYYMKDDMLVRKSYSDPHLNYIKYQQMLKVLYEIHDGEYRNHTKGQIVCPKGPRHRLLLVYHRSRLHEVRLKI